MRIMHVRSLGAKRLSRFCAVATSIVVFLSLLDDVVSDGTFVLALLATAVSGFSAGLLIHAVAWVIEGFTDKSAQ